MAWKPWVQIEKRDTSNQETKQMYNAVMDKETKVIPDLARLTSTTPQIALDINRLHDSIAENKTGLSNKEVEIAATIVAVFNGCVHWTAWHKEALGREIDNEFASKFVHDYTQAGLNSREKAIADYAVKITRSPNAVSPDDIDKLRSEGLSDRDIVSLVEIIAYYNMSTRIFESLSTIE